MSFWNRASSFYFLLGSPKISLRDKSCKTRLINPSLRGSRDEAPVLCFLKPKPWAKIIQAVIALSSVSSFLNVEFFSCEDHKSHRKENSGNSSIDTHVIDRNDVGLNGSFYKYKKSANLREEV